MKTISNSENFNYPKLQRLEEFFRSEISNKDIDFSQVVLVVCQHLLEPQKVMFQHLINLGFFAENIFVVGKVYSTNNEVENEINKLGITVIQPRFNQEVSFDVQHKDNCNQLWKLSENKRQSCEKLIVLDDGGVMIETVIESGQKKFIGIEQTSSGFRKLEHKDLAVPIFNVARSRTKLELETPYVVALGVQRIEESMKKYGIEKPNILVVGQGPIGMEIQKVLMEKDFSITTHDKIHGEKNIFELVKNQQVIIGTTGSQILSHDEIVEMNKTLSIKTLFISMSSSDREFELWRLRDLFAPKENIHEDVQFGNIIIINNGFPITFKGNRYEAPPNQIERTICLLFAGVGLALVENNLAKGLIDIPEKLIKIIE